MAEVFDHTAASYADAVREGLGDAGPDADLAWQDRVEAAEALRRAAGVVAQDCVSIANDDPRYVGLEP